VKITPVNVLHEITCMTR